MSTYIPRELISIILARLAIDDVLRCTSVCKSWYHLITSPSFISLHAKLSIPNQQSRLLFKIYTQNDSFRAHLDNQTLDEIAELHYPGKFPTKFELVGSINGLLCFYETELFCTRILLWNPSLRKSFFLPETRVSSNKRSSVGFTFVPETNDYKIVRVLDIDMYNDDIELGIYELSTNTWRTIHFTDFPFDLPLGFNPAAVFNDNLHWEGVNPQKVCGDFDKFIVSFDVKNEELGALMLPESLQNREGNGVIKVEKYKDSLCVIHDTATYHSIWVMKEYGVEDSWELLFNIDYLQHGIFELLHFRENGEVIFKTIIGEWAIYDPTSDQVMNTGRNGMCGTTYMNISVTGTAYMESLVLIKSLNQVLRQVKLIR